MNKLQAIIPCDWGYAYDYLSIFEVKISKTNRDEKSISNHQQATDCILRQIGMKHYEVINSEEYKNLYAVNQRLFELVDLAKSDSVKASEVDEYVYKRYLAKIALLNKFFPSSEVGEQKIGYKQ